MISISGVVSKLEKFTIRLNILILSFFVLGLTLVEQSAIAQSGAGTPKLVGVSAHGTSTNNNDWGITIYTIDKNGTFDPLYTNNRSNGEVGSGQVEITRAAGKYWVVTYSGGTGINGTLFTIEPDGSGFNKIFDYRSNLGLPSAALVESNGRLWGVSGLFGKDYIYSLKTDGTDLQIAKTLNRSASEGIAMSKLLVIGNEFYGVARLGGSNDVGLVFKIDNTGNNYQVLFSFPVNEGYPQADLVYVNGRLWGTTSGVPTGSPRYTVGADNTHGTVFSIKPDGTDYRLVHRFAKTNSGDSDVLDGRHVTGPLVQAGNKLYGTAEYGGTNGDGVLFSIDLADNSFNKVHDFVAASGQYPRGNLSFHDSELWGTTFQGGVNDYGTVYRFDPNTNTHVKVRDMSLTSAAYPLDARFVAVADPVALEFANVPDQELYEDMTGDTRPLPLELDLSTYATGTGVTFELVSVSNTDLFPSLTVTEAGIVRMVPAENKHGTAEVTVKAKDSSGATINDTFNILVNPVADGPSITAASTIYGSQTTSGLVVSRNAIDGDEVTHFYVQTIYLGTLYHADGITQINTGDYITAAEGAAGLKFTPSAAGAGHIQVYGATGTSGANELGSGLSEAIISTDAAPLTITVQDETITAGDAIPAFTLQYSGFVNGDDETGITAPTASAGSNILIDPGTYPVTLSGGASDNYDFNFVSGTLTIEAQPFKMIGVTAHGTSTNINAWGITIFTIEEDGTYTSLFTSTSSTDGYGSGRYGLVKAAGKFWGASYSGTGRQGTLYSLEGNGTGFQEIFPFPFSYGLPVGALVESNGRLWGTSGTSGKPVIYSLKTDGTDIRKDYEFPKIVGQGITPLLVVGDQLYGSVNGGGAADEGRIFRIDNDGSNFQVLFDFPFAEGHPDAELTFANGRLWGTTKGDNLGYPRGIAGKDNSHGTIFSINPDGTDYQLVYRFDLLPGETSIPDGRHLNSGLSRVNNKLWGTAPLGGANNQGVIFYIDLSDNSFNKVYDFEGTLGSEPFATLTVHNGKLWGTTFKGGVHDKGTVFTFDPSTLVYTKLRDMELTAGAFPIHAKLIPFNFTPTVAWAEIPDQEMVEDAEAIQLDLKLYSYGSNLSYQVESISNSELFPELTIDANGKLNIKPYLNRYGTAEITVRAVAGEGSMASKTFNINVLPAPDSPEVTAGNTTYGATNPVKVAVRRHVSDGIEVTHFQVSELINGTLYLSDGSTVVSEGSFLSFEAASRGLLFAPEMAGQAGFKVQAATSNTSDKLGGDKSLVSITVSKAPLTIEVDDQEITLGAEIPALTFKYSGFVNGDDPSSISEPTVSTLATTSSPVGTYHIVLQGGEASNYSLALINGLLTIKTTTTTPLEEFEDRLIGTGTFAPGSSATGSSIFAVTEALTIENWLNVNGADGSMGETRWTLVEANGKLWGVTYGGGANNLGILFTIEKDGTGFTKVHDFDFSYGYPTSGLTLAGGYLYGSTAAGFGQNTGVIYRITPANTTPEMVHEFSNRDGWEPRGLIEAAGKLYGMTHYGGDYSQGVIFSLNVDGTGFEKIFDFENEKGRPEGELLFYQGRLWGTAKASRFNYPLVLQNTDPVGHIFSLLTDGSNFRIEHTFIKTNPGDTEYNNGRHPFGNLVAAEGKLWGMTPFGGENGLGVIFQLDPTTSQYQKVYDFSASGGSYPRGSFLLYQGKLWGMTYEGGTNSLGTIFTFDPTDNAFSKIADLSNATGGKPVDGHFMVIKTKKKFNVDIPDIIIEEGASTQVLDLAKYFADLLDKVVGQPVYSLSGNTAPALFTQADMTGTVLSFTPTEQASGSISFTISLSGDEDEVALGKLNIIIRPVIDGINATEAVTATYGTLANDVVEVSRHALDNQEVSHFKISGLSGLKVFRPDGLTEISEGEFLTFEQAQPGLKVMPTQVGEMTIQLQAATAASNEALGGEVAEVKVTAGKADLFVTTDNLQITYGDALPTFVLNYQGFVAGESESDITVPQVSTTALANADAGDYAINVTGGVAQNYNLHLQNGIFTIAKAILNATVADDYLYVPERIQPNLSVQITGFVNGQDQSVLDQLPTASSAVNAYSPVGDYLVPVTGGVAKNYTFNRVSGTIRVGSKAPETGDIGNPDRRRGKFVLVGTSTYNGGTLFSIDATDYTKRWHQFNSLSAGQNPISNLEEANEKMWGVTSIGGENTAGVLYSISKDQQYTKVHDFDFTNGAQPIGTPVFANNRLWGTTSLGGLNNQGVIYSIKTDGTDYQIHYNFDGTTGAFPSNGLLLAGDKLWGMTTFGGANQRGVIYNISTAGTGFNIIHEFGDKKGIPFGELVLANGKLWGLTRESQGPQQFFVAGDAEDNGAIFSINLDGSGYTEVHQFAKVDNKDLGLKNGRHPHGSLVAFDGALWGMTTYGGDVNGSNFGTIFKLDISGATPVFTKKHDFDAQQTGGYPKGNLVVFEDQLWGMTSERGQSNLGTIFSFNPDTEAISARHHFNASIGGNSVTSFQRVFIDLVPTLKASIPDQKVNEGTAMVSVNLDDHFSDQDLQSANLDYDISVSGTPGIVSQSEVSGKTLNLYLSDNAIGTVNVSVKASAALPETVTDVFAIEVVEIPDAPVVQNINAVYGALSTEAVQITKNPLDGPDVGHFQITEITNGLLYHKDGVSQVNAGDFINTAQGLSGLRFLPTAVGQGSFSIQASTANNQTGLGPDKSTALITSGKAPLQVKANNLTATYGASLPTYTLSYSGFVLGDDVSDITPPVVSSLGTTSTEAHTYILELEGGSSEKYELQLIDGLLTVQKASLTASADDQTISQGEALPEFTVSYQGFVNGDTPAELTAPAVSTTYETSAGPGQYDIQMNGGFSENYTISRVDGRLTVTNAKLIITADSKEIVYGETVPELTLTVSGLEAGGSISDVELPTLNLVVDERPPAGEYTIELVGGSSDTYELVLQNGTLKVTPKALTVTAENKSISTGDDMPDLTMNVSGFVNGDDLSSITLPTITTTAANTNTAGQFPITLSGGLSANYNMSFVHGQLSINKSVLTVKANDQQFVYGTQVPELTMSYQGFKNGDDASSISGPVASTTATSTSPVGDYAITLSGGISDKYEYQLEAGTVSITKAQVFVDIHDITMNYGELWEAFPTGDITGLIPGDEHLLRVLPYKVSVRAKESWTPFAGAYSIELNPDFRLDNYELAWNPGVLTVNKVDLTITADDKAITYGEEIPALSLSYSGFVSTDTEADITAPNITTSANTGSGAGTYAISLTGDEAENYNLVLNEGSLTIGKAGLTITADDKQIAYGGTIPEFTLSYEGFVNGDGANDINIPSATASATQNSAVGSYPIALSGGSANNYDLTLVNGDLTIGKTQLTVTADNKEFNYGTDVPAHSLSYEGFVNGDNENDITPPEATTVVVSTSDVGDYDITLSGGAANNYELVLVNGVITVSKASLSIQTNDETITYGESLPAFSATITGLVPGDEAIVASLSHSTSATNVPNAGTYAVTPTGVSASNYNLEMIAGTLTVNKAQLTATADDKAMTYGEDIPTLSLSYSGFVSTDTKAYITEPSLSTTATANSGAGTYTITLSGGESENYNLVLNDGSLTINKANLTITAADKQMGYGASIPVLTLLYEGFKNGDGAEDINAPVATVAANEQSDIGIYPILLSGGSANNYNLSLVNGQLTIGKAILTITADNKEFVYGTDVPALSLSYQGFANGDDESSIEAPVASTTVTNKSDVGTYEIALSGGSSDKYDLQLVNGTVTVNKASLSIQVDDIDISYGEAVPGFTANIIGIVPGDESILSTLSYTSAAGSTPNAGTYSITPEGVTANNYQLELTPGTLTVNKVPLTITAHDKAITYGDALPAFSMEYSGFITGESESDITPPAIITSATNSSGAGNYPITITGGESVNYSFVLNDANLSIAKAKATVKIVDADMTYGATVPTFSAQYIGLVNGHQPADFNGEITLTSVAGTNPQSGTYTIEANLAQFSNYDFTVETGTLTVNKADLTITADDKQMAYGSAVPDWTLSYVGFVNGEGSGDITKPGLTAAITSQTAAGIYPISLSGGAAANYNISLVNGTCEIKPITLIVRVATTEITYGQEIPELTYNITGFANQDDETDIEAMPVIENDLPAQSGVGAYPLSATGGSAANYIFAYIPGTLTILPAKLTITAEDLNMIYGDTPPNAAISYVGFQYDEGPSVLSQSPIAVVNANSSTNAGTYPIRLVAGGAANYDVELVNGTITVGKAPLFASINDLELIYGSAIPPLVVQYDGFKAGDNERSIAPPFPITAATSRSDVGTYPIDLSGGSSVNYDLIKENGLITIIKAEQTIEFTVDQTNVRPSQTIELNARSSSGLALTFTISDESLMSIENGIATPLNVGRVTVTASHPGNQNYHAAESVSGNFNIISRIAIGRAQRVDLAYPNPTENSFRVKEPVDMIEMYDQQGLLVKRFEGDFETFDVSDLKRGVYTVYYYKGDEIGMSRLLIWR